MRLIAFFPAFVLLAFAAPVNAKNVYLTCEPYPESYSAGMYQAGYIVNLSDQTVYAAWRRFGPDHPKPHNWKGENMTVEKFSSREISFYAPATVVAGISLPRLASERLDRAALEVISDRRTLKCQQVDKPFMEIPKPKF